jgi:hypothetical protein
MRDASSTTTTTTTFNHHHHHHHESIDHSFIHSSRAMDDDHQHPVQRRAHAWNHASLCDHDITITSA